MEETINLKETVENLNEGETLVIVTRDQKGFGYFIAIVDQHSKQEMAVTQAELNKIVMLGNRYITDD